MSQYFVTINSTETFQLFHWNGNSFKLDPQLHLATDDLAHVHNVFEEIASISITDDQGNEVAHFTEYDGFSSINYLGKNYSDQLNGFANELVITLTKVSLVEQVQRLDEQVNKIVDVDSMTTEEYKEWKINKFSEMGEQVIFAGTDVTLLNGVVKNFTYDLEDQSNLLNAIFIIQALDDLTITLPYHGHGEPCELYSAIDVLAVYFTLQFFSTRIQTEVNMKINWVRSCETKEEAMAIEFDTPLPEEWAQRAEAIMGPAIELARKLQEQYFGEGVAPIDPTELEEGEDEA